jgi:ABC-type multidrug transport system ATPase subunit
MAVEIAVEKENLLLRVYRLGLTLDGTEMFRDVDLSLEKQRCYLVAGPDDMANVYLLKGMAGLLPDHPLQGRVWFDGMDIYNSGEEELKEIKKRVAFVFCEGTLIANLTVEENLLLPLRYHAPHVEQETVMAKIEEGFDYFGIPDVLPCRPAELSYSVKKKLAFVRAALREPELIFMDRPLFNLAEKERDGVMAYLEQLKQKGLTLVMTSHCPSKFEALTDETITLEEGVVRTGA